MRKPLIGLLVACVAGFVLIAANTDKKTVHHECKCSEWIKNAEYDVSNIENGIMIKITSDKPDVVKLIQEYASKCIIECKLGTGTCEHKEGSAEYKGETIKCKLIDGKCVPNNPGCELKKESGECKKP